MKNKKSAALLSKNPTFDLLFLSRQFIISTNVDVYHEKLKNITKNFSSGKRSFIQSLVSKPKVEQQYQKSHTQVKQNNKKRIMSLPKLQKARSNSFKLQKIIRDVKKSQKNILNSIVQQKFYSQKIIGQKEKNLIKMTKFPFQIKKYGSWFSKQ